MSACRRSSAPPSPGRHRRRHRLQPRGVLRDRRARPRRLADHRGADRGERARLEGIRDGGRPRQGGQLHHRLLDREHRPDGRAHRRFHHRRAGADADRQGIPDHAQRLDRGAARDRRRDRRLQRAVRRQPGERPHGRHRDEPARLALLGAGLEGDRLPDRQGRGQARRRLHAGRARERHHRRRDAGLLRADDRLRRHQDPALRLREIPRRRAGADHRDEVGRRGRWRSAAPSRNRCRRRCARWRPASPASTRSRSPASARATTSNAIRAALGTPTPDRLLMVAQAMRLGISHDEVHASLQDRPVVPGADRRHRRHGSAHPRARPARRRRRLLRMLKAMGFSDARLAVADAAPTRPRSGAAARRARRAPGLQAHRHLRGRVRLADRLHVLDLRGALRRRARRRGAGLRRARRSSSSAAARTASARASSSTIAAATPPSR